MRVFDKKFKKRVKPFGHGYYIVQYTYYRFIPNWVNINVDSQEQGESVGCLNIRLFGKGEAEVFINRLNEVGDVIALYNKQRVL